MLRILIPLITISLLTSCNNAQDKSASVKDRVELVPEPDKELRENYEAKQKLQARGCIFLNPDTSLSKMKLRDSESTETIIGLKDKIDINDQYHYYSTTNREMLTLTQYPGDGKYQISIFKVEYPGKADHGYRKLSIDSFKTEKGIKLGMGKVQIIERLGSCYTAQDSSGDYIELYYKLELPDDSKTKILESNNMPVYYASYVLKNDKLQKFEFGFEYP